MNTKILVTGASGNHCPALHDAKKGVFQPTVVYNRSVPMRRRKGKLFGASLVLCNKRRAPVEAPFSY
jgi:hypothetical protein